MARKEIVFSAKDTGVATVMQKLRQSANELGRELIQDARNYTSSGKEAVRFIEEQIKAMERRNKLAKEEAKFVLDSQRAQQMQGANSSERQKIDAKYKEKLSDINMGNKEDEMQITLLRELIETIKTTARDEISADRKDVTRQIANDKRLNELGLEAGEDEIEQLKKSIQREEIGTINESEQNEKEKFNAARAGKRASDETASALSRPNEIYAVAGMLALIPIVGDGLAMLANKALGEAEARQDSQAKARGQAGGIDVTMAGYGHGMNIAEATAMFGSSQISGNARALGMVNGMNHLGFMGRAGGREAMDLQMSRGIDAGALNNLGGFAGYSSDNSLGIASNRKSAGGMMFDALAKSFADTGLLGSSGTMTQNMPSLMSQVSTVLGNLTDSLDEVSMGQVMGGMSKLTGLGGSFADPEKVGSRYMQIHQGLTDTSNPYAQAAKFWTMQGMGGAGKSRFELMEMQEKGMTEPGYMKEYMTKLHQMSGGNKDIFMEEVKAAFPQLSYSNTRKMVEGFMKDPDVFDVDFKSMVQGKADITTPGWAGDLAVSTAEWSDAFADAGESMVSAANTVKEAIEKLISYM